MYNVYTLYSNKLHVLKALKNIVNAVLALIYIEPDHIKSVKCKNLFSKNIICNPTHEGLTKQVDLPYGKRVAFVP